MTTFNYTYKGALEASEKVNWRVEDIIGPDKKLDFTRPFLPETLARVGGLSFLDDEEKRTLNQIRGLEYLYMFGLVEEFILPFVLDQTRPHLHGDDYRVRALLRFAGEEAKHIHLFKRFRSEFESGFGSDCQVIGPPEAISRAVLAHHPLAVGLVTEHIEWMTQRHYLDSVRDDQDLDPQFRSLLRHHWMEEAQHAKLDALLVAALAEASTDGETETAIGEYAAIGSMLDEGLRQQVQLNLRNFEAKTGRRLNDDETAEYTEVQTQAIRWTYLGSGMTHPNFLASIEAIRPAARATVEEMAPAFC